MSDRFERDARWVRLAVWTSVAVVLVVTGAVTANVVQRKQTAAHREACATANPLHRNNWMSISKLSSRSSRDLRGLREGDFAGPATCTSQTIAQGSSRIRIFRSDRVPSWSPWIAM